MDIEMVQQKVFVTLFFFTQKTADGRGPDLIGCRYCSAGI